jgi:hypothetical protein
MLKTKLLKLTSDHDTSHSNHSSFKYNLGYIDDALERVKSIVLISAVIPNSQPSINANCNTLRYELNGGGIASLVVPSGQYSTTTLIAYLQTQLAGTTWTQDTTTNKVNIATNGATTLDLYSKGTDPLSTLAPRLGLNTDITLAISSNDDCENIPNLNGTSMFLLESNAISSNNTLTSISTNNRGSSSNVFCAIPVTAPYGAVNVFNDQGFLEQTRVTFDSPRGVGLIDIKITDENGNTLYLESPSTLIFRIYY